MISCRFSNSCGLACSDEASNQKRLPLRKSNRTSCVGALTKLQALKQLCNAHLASDTSAKLDWLRDWLEDIVASGNKVLVFSQYREFGLEFLAKKLAAFG